MEHRIKISILGCYHRDSKMNITRNVLPPKLNENRQFIGKPSREFPHLKLPSVEEQEATKKPGDELKMESLINYVAETGWGKNPKPDFVTTKQLLGALCVPPGRKDAKDCVVHAVRLDGVKYLLKANEDEPVNWLLGAVFEHYFTKTKDTEPFEESGCFWKLVYNAHVPHGNYGDSWNILYSGQIDACDGDALNERLRLYEMKTNSGEIVKFFWESKSCLMYWQSFFGNSYEIIIGKRTGKNGKIFKNGSFVSEGYPFTVFEVISKKPSELVYQDAVNNDAHNDYNNNWSIESGEDLLKKFLNLVNENLTEDGQCFVFEKKKEDVEWAVVCTLHSKVQTKGFHDFLVEKLGKPEAH